MKVWILAIIGCLFATGAFANTSFLQLSLTPDIALHSRTTQINGLALNIWGENPQNALALGIVNGASGYSSGIALGLLANYSESYTGAQLSGIVNYASGQLTGLQWSLVNYAAKLHGVQLGLVNFAAHADKGLQLGLINIMEETNQWFRNFPGEIAPVMVFVNWRF